MEGDWLKEALMRRPGALPVFHDLSAPVQRNPDPFNTERPKMTDVTTTAPKAATLSQSELFRRYLDAPVRVDATTSTLIADHGQMFDKPARDWFLYEGFGDSLPSDYAEELLAQIEDDECPLFELERITGDLSNLLSALNALKKDFCRLTYATRTEEPASSAPEEVYEDWEQNLRYVLPVIEQKKAA